MKVNSVQSNPSFGTLKISKNANELLIKRLRSEADVYELKKLFEEQANNKFDVCIFSRKDAKFLTGYIKSGKKNNATYDESALGVFLSPMDFIRNLCSEATYLNKRSKFMNGMSEIFKQ